MEITEKIIYKNKTNWFTAIILPIPLLLFTFAILIILPLIIITNSDIFSIIYFLGFGILSSIACLFFLKLWLWNTFGKTILEISKTQIKISKKNNLFYKTKTFKKDEIQNVIIENRDVESNGYYTRLNYIFSNSNQTIAIQNGNKIVRIVEWLTNEDAKNGVEKINKILGIN